MVTLTFDDGPDAVGTPRILRELRLHAAPSIFFVVAPRALAHPHLIRQMLDEGHEVGLHCWAHTRHSARTRGAVADDTDRALAALAALKAASILRTFMDAAGFSTSFSTPTS